MSDDLEAKCLEARLASMEARIATLEAVQSPRKGGRPSKKLVVKAEHVCGIDPDRDSSTCPDASLYRRRQGCQGDACALASSTYYKDRQ
jgi:hypothetical protein